MSQPCIVCTMGRHARVAALMDMMDPLLIGVLMYGIGRGMTARAELCTEHRDLAQSCEDYCGQPPAPERPS